MHLARVVLNLGFLFCFWIGDASGQVNNNVPVLVTTDQPVSAWISQKLFYAANGHRSIEMHINKSGKVDSVFVVNRILDSDKAFEETRDSVDKSILMTLEFKPLKHAVRVKIKNYNIIKGSLFPMACENVINRFTEILEGLYYDERETYFSGDKQQKGYFVWNDQVIFEPTILMGKE